MNDANQPSTMPSSPLAKASAFVSGLSPRAKLIGAGLIAAIVLALALSSSGGRVITINGYQLSPEEIAYLDAVAGGQVPDANYWLDPQSMAWGIVGDPQPRGVIGYGGGQSTGQPPHWSEVGQNYRGPFGDYMSDGKCSAVNGIMVGEC
jgi:hypothetical protein